MTLLGRDPSRPDDRTRIRERLGYPPQDAGFHRGFTVFEFIDYVAILKEMTDRRARHDEVRRVITLAGRGGARNRRRRLAPLRPLCDEGFRHPSADVRV